MEHISTILPRVFDKIEKGKIKDLWLSDKDYTERMKLRRKIERDARKAMA
jgi:hypothetical protein